MASVYGSALCTLSALSSEDSTQGCRVADSSSLKRDRRFFDFDIGAYRIRMFAKGIFAWTEEYGKDTCGDGESRHNPLRGRAWVLQERELSFRNIQFSQHQILWECRTMRGSSEMLWQELELENDPQPSPVSKFCGEQNHVCLLRDRWYVLMDDYMSRSLSKGIDKLAALSGLAQDFQKKLSTNQYVAGIWTQSLPQSLLWRVVPSEKPSTTPLKYRAPSWSFLSLDATISYESQRLVNRGEFESADTAIDCGPPNLSVLGFDVVPEASDIYGTIKGASLALRGRMVQLHGENYLSCSRHHSPASSKPENVQFGSGQEFGGEEHNITHDLEHSLGRTKGSLPCAIYFDDAISTLDNSPFWCVSVCQEPCWTIIPNPFDREPSESKHVEPAYRTIMGLVVQRVSDGSPNTYRRVGLVRWLKESSFADAQESDFLLV